MVAFHDVRLPEDIERGATGGLEFSTASNTLASGRRVVNIEWDQPLGGWDVGYGIQDLDGLRDVKAFHMCRRGSAYAFRFKDWFDFQLARQSIGAGDGATTDFQIYKRYDDGGPLPFDFDIQLPVSGTLLVWVAGAAQTEGADFTADYQTGIVTFAAAPTAGQAIEVQCDFDMPVSFVKDRLDIQVETFLNGKVPKIEIQLERL